MVVQRPFPMDNFVREFGISSGEGSITAKFSEDIERLGTGKVDVVYRTGDRSPRVDWQRKIGHDGSTSSTVFYHDENWTGTESFAGPEITDIDGIEETAAQFQEQAERTELRQGPGLKQDKKDQLQEYLEQENIPYSNDRTGTKIAVYDAGLEEFYTALYIADPELQENLSGRPTQEALNYLEKQAEKASRM